MDACETQNPCPEDHKSTPVKRKRKLVEKKKKVVLEKSKAVKKKKAKPGALKTGKKSDSTKRKRTQAHELYDDVEAKFTVMEKAYRVFTSLAIETPFFLKCMLPSNVTYSFWMIMPRRFCSLYLPSQDSTVILVDEWGKECKTTYLVHRHGLSAGWRGFAMSHRLLKGDILIFNLVEHCKFKVHIVRVHAVDVVNAAICLMNMDGCGVTTESGLGKQDNRKRKRTKKYAEPTILDAPRIQVKVEEKCSDEVASNLVTMVDQSETCSDSFCSEVVQGAEVSDHCVPTDHAFPETAFIRPPPCGGVTCR